MNIVTRLFTSAATILLAASPALAVETGFSFDFTSRTNTALAGLAGNAMTFSATDAAGTVRQVRATGWTATWSQQKNGYVVAAAYLGRYQGGLGVTAASPKDARDGGNNTHMIDNVGSVDFVLFQFDRDVDLNGIGKSAYGIYDHAGRVSYDSDASVARGQTAVAWTAAYDLTGHVFAANALPTTLDETAAHGRAYASSAAITADGHYNLWAVGAAYTTKGNDGFKLSGVSGSWNRIVPPDQSHVPAVPEPSTWGMMILGFALVGAAARRRGVMAPQAE